MTPIRIDLAQTVYAPGARLSGKAGWMLDKEPRKVEVRLFWRTAGKGTEDLEVVDSLLWDDPAAREMRDFTFQLPIAPYSFSGQLITLTWGVEVVAGKQSDSIDFVLSPHGREILLTDLSS